MTDVGEPRGRLLLVLIRVDVGQSNAPYHVLIGSCGVHRSARVSSIERDDIEGVDVQQLLHHLTTTEAELKGREEVEFRQLADVRGMAGGHLLLQLSQGTESLSEGVGLLEDFLPPLSDALALPRDLRLCALELDFEEAELTSSLAMDVGDVERRGSGGDDVRQAVSDD